MKLSTLQRYNLNHCLKFFRGKVEYQPLTEILKEILNEDQSRDEFKKSMLALIKIGSTKGPMEDAAGYIIAYFCRSVQREIFNEIAQELNAGGPDIIDPTYWPQLVSLMLQKFLPALPMIEAATLGYAPAQLMYGKFLFQGHYLWPKIYKMKASVYFMKAFEQGIEDDQSIYEYTMSLNNKLLDRSSYLWKTLIDRNGEYSEKARFMLDQLTLGGNNSILKPFQQLLKDATPVENTVNGGLITFESFGNVRAQALVGFCYHIGLGVEQNIAKAIHFYKLSRDPYVFWDLLSCFRHELKNGVMDLKEVLEFYKQYLNCNSSYEFYKIPASLVLARIYYEGITGFVYPNLFKAYEYYVQALKLTSFHVTPDHWIEENNLAEHGVETIRPLIESRDQIVTSLAPVGITLPLCHLVAEYMFDFPWHEPSDFMERISEIDAAFSCIENNNNVETSAIKEKLMPTKPLVLSGLSSVVEPNSSAFPSSAFRGGCTSTSAPLLSKNL